MRVVATAAVWRLGCRLTRGVAREHGPDGDRPRRHEHLLNLRLVVQIRQCVRAIARQELKRCHPGLDFVEEYPDLELLPVLGEPVVVPAEEISRVRPVRLQAATATSRRR